MRHVVYLIGEDWFFASHFARRAQAALEAGWRVSVVTRIGEATPALRARGVEVHGVDFVRARVNPIAEAALAWQIARVYRRLQPDLVHHVALKPIILGAVAARLAGIRAVVNAPVGGGFVFSSQSLKARLLRPAVRIAMHAALRRRGSITVFENSEDRQAAIAAEAVPSARAVLIRGAGVDIERFSPHPKAEAPLRVVLGARMLADKGVREFIAAARLLHARGIEAEFVLAGDPDSGNPTSIDPAELEAAPDVLWRGKVADMAGLLAASHVACLPSYREGMPKFLLEAMASGLPCVTTDTPGCREAVIAGETGLLVPPRDPEALADALGRLLTDPALRARLGEAGRGRTVAEFSDEVVCAATLAVYEQAVSAHSVSGAVAS